MNERESFSARLEELCLRAERMYEPTFTHFLTPEEGQAALAAAKAHPDLFVLAFGGFADAERKIFGYFPADIYTAPNDLFGSEELWTEYDSMAELSYVKITGSGYRNFSHRDILGSIMACGTKRESLGDILVTEDQRGAYVVTTQKIAPYLCDTLTHIGSDKVKVSLCKKEDLPALSKRFIDLSLSIASTRLDALVAAVTNKSRDHAKKLIAAGKVSLNHTECLSCDKAFAEGDTVSVKGEGKFLVEGFLGKSGKGRDRVVVRKYV